MFSADLRQCFCVPSVNVSGLCGQNMQQSPSVYSNTHSLHRFHLRGCFASFSLSSFALHRTGEQRRQTACSLSHPVGAPVRGSLERCCLCHMAPRTRLEAGTVCDERSEAGKPPSSKSKPRAHQSPGQSQDLCAMKMSSKAIKLAESPLQGHLRIIALSDFSLVLPVLAKFSILVCSTLTTEIIKIIICWRTFKKSF